MKNIAAKFRAENHQFADQRASCFCIFLLVVLLTFIIDWIYHILPNTSNCSGLPVLTLQWTQVLARVTQGFQGLPVLVQVLSAVLEKFR